MKKRKVIFVAVVCIAMVFTMMACSAGNKDMGFDYPDYSAVSDKDDFIEGLFDTNYQYEGIVENPFYSVEKNPSSYFSLDRNTAGYSIVRTQIENGMQVAPNSVRIEEMINYFDYNLPRPTEEGIGICSGIMDCPWNSQNKLVMLGITTAEVNMSDKNGNYVFLIDVSGSMSGKRIDLAKKGMKMLVDELSQNDTVSIVTYSNEIKQPLVGKNGSQKQEIKSAIDSLVANGGTNGAGGLSTAYDIAKQYYIKDGNNRVIIVSDGDFNVGMSSVSEMKNFISAKAKTGIYLSVVGVGMGNMRDDMLNTLALAGNGNYSYVDTETEAEKVFKYEISGNLYTVAKDAKAGITFNDNVVKYRLIGYDTKLMSEEDFDDPTKDSGEIGSGFCVGIVYEVQLKEGVTEGVVAEAEIRYKDVRTEVEIPKNISCSVDFTPQPDYENDAKFASCVIEFGLILRQSQYKGNADIDNILERLNDLQNYISNDPYKTEFVALVKKYKSMQ